MREDILINDRAAAIGEQLIEKFETIYDPEIGLDIYNLGLLYEIDLTEDGHCKVVVTFTSMGCGCMVTVPNEIVVALKELDGIKEVSVETVWSPSWKVTRISRFGRISLGISPR
ncbi:metal-sulfur cluster assembly factor [Enterococcus xiangfangensis]|uniref:Metal-sulfur cluster assembly factor n=1 Tax=Enterococcus xiangfangensis TaxID=1296537 RepID=A0ABU3FBC2_9ENTE|nr:metal-sulfur cluster assembly factor [Enterococcus xiangfangensis]MBM7710934.1 metal-sulfur cluster biosynthetic enzyme [Enterococcus xiangfangensis]MDT2759005.1 metal-sulfur cluster assembly factor [Enterococcus xiangfangensis]NBK07866.1 metal-sulfur cluster assembly factor [Enterococcus asini]